MTSVAGKLSKGCDLLLMLARLRVLWLVAVSACFVWPCDGAGFGIQRDWVRTYRLDPSKTNQSWKICLASDGVIVAGTSVGEFGDTDYLIIKYKTNGDEAWKQRYSTVTGVDDNLRGLACDPAGNVFVTGTTDTVKFSREGVFRWAAEFGGRAVAAGTNFVYVTGFSESDFATVQLENDDTEGRLGWTRTFDGSLHSVDISHTIALTDSEAVLVGGAETTIPGLGGGASLSVVKYATNGTQIWHGKSNSGLGHGSTTRARDLAIATNGSVYIFGDFSGVGQLARFEPNGTHAWTLGPGIADPSWGMKLTRDQGAVCVGGVFTGGYITEITSHRLLRWQYVHTNPSESGAEMRAVFVGSNGNIYAAGFAVGAGSDLDIVLLGLNSEGTRLTEDVFDSPHHGNDVANGIVVDDLENIYVTGYSTTPEGGTEFVTIKFSPGPKIERKTDGAMHLEFRTNPGQHYAIEGTTNLLDWESLFSATADVNGLVQFDDTNAAQIPFRFYRGNSVQ